MAKRSSFLAQDLLKRYKALERTRVKIEKMSGMDLICRRDVERVYEGLFLNAYVSFEGFIEKLFLSLLVSDGRYKSSRSDIVPRIGISTQKIAQELLIGPQKKYVDWLPYQKTIELSKLYFRGGKPFTALNDNQKQILSKCCIIRNAITHRSRHSIAQFKNEIISNTPIPHQEQSPASFLRGLFRIAPTQTRYENFTAQLSLIAKFLAH